MTTKIHIDVVSDSGILENSRTFMRNEERVISPIMTSRNLPTADGAGNNSRLVSKNRQLKRLTEITSNATLKSFNPTRSEI